jgi:Na+-translocating ferredoxin:NAD+ oxidoreductase RnfE subunit
MQSDGQDGAWLKRLFAHISRQLRIPIGIVSADTEQCYDRIAHVFASLVYQAFGVFITAVIAMLASIQHMRFYLRTGLGESIGFMTVVLGCIIQGLCQGNSAAPAGWSLISAVLIKVYNLQESWTWCFFPDTDITRVL